MKVATYQAGESSKAILARKLQQLAHNVIKYLLITCILNKTKVCRKIEVQGQGKEWFSYEKIHAFILLSTTFAKKFPN